MTDVTITDGTNTFTFQDGDVQSVTGEVTGQPDAIPMPGSAPANTIIFDLGGANKIITVSGFLHAATTTRVSGGSTVTTILAQKEWLETLIDGSQSTVVFTSNYESNTCDGTGHSTTPTKVVVQRAIFTERTGDPNSLGFTMTLRVGT